jgi:hypothetical protein
MLKSETISELAKALSKAQSEIVGAKKDSSNSFYHSTYADLASCFAAIREPFSRNGLSILQPTDEHDNHTYVDTIILHNSGEWISSRLRVVTQKTDAQAIGSAISYARRYALCSLAGIPQIDDDGNAAVGKVEETHAFPKVEPPKFNVPNLAPKASQKSSPLGHKHKFSPDKYNPAMQRCTLKLADGSWCNYKERRPDVNDETAFIDNMPIKINEHEDLPF